MLSSSSSHSLQYQEALTGQWLENTDLQVYSRIINMYSLSIRASMLR